MPAGLTSSDSMFSVREERWHRLGAVLPEAPSTIAEAIAWSGLQIDRLNMLSDEMPHLPFPHSSQIQGELRELRAR